jgi:hypothetical protein
MEKNILHKLKVKTSGIDEPKFLFSHGIEDDIKNPDNNAGTLDELPCNESPEVLFSQTQS